MSCPWPRVDNTGRVDIQRCTDPSISSLDSLIYCLYAQQRSTSLSVHSKGPHRAVQLLYLPDTSTQVTLNVHLDSVSGVVSGPWQRKKQTSFAPGRRGNSRVFVRGATLEKALGTAPAHTRPYTERGRRPEQKDTGSGRLQPMRSEQARLACAACSARHRRLGMPFDTVPQWRENGTVKDLGLTGTVCELGVCVVRGRLEVRLVGGSCRSGTTAEKLRGRALLPGGQDVIGYFGGLFARSLPATARTVSVQYSDT